MTAANKTAKTTEVFESMMNINPDSFKDGYSKLAEGVSAMAEFQKGSVEALMAAAGAFAKGVEQMTAEQASFTKAAFEDGVANAKAAATSGSIQEAFDLNSEFMRASVEKNLNQFNKVAEICVETSKGTAAPLSERYGELVEKIQAYRP